MANRLLARRKSASGLGRHRFSWIRSPCFCFRRFCFQTCPTASEARPGPPLKNVGQAKAVMDGFSPPPARPTKKLPPLTESPDIAKVYLKNGSPSLFLPICFRVHFDRKRVWTIRDEIFGLSRCIETPQAPVSSRMLVKSPAARFGRLPFVRDVEPVLRFQSRYDDHGRRKFADWMQAQ